MSTRRPSRLPLWQEWAVYAGLGLLVASGIGWLVLDQSVRVIGEFGSEHHPAERWALIMHGISAYFFLIVAGAMIPVHVQLGWRIGRNRSSGIIMASSCILLALTALGLYYFGDEVARHWTSVVHWGVGLAVGPMLAIHSINGRRGRYN